MNYEQLAFVNQQLAGMLRSGIPLEGALRQLCVNMRRGRFRTELEALEADLAKGVPLKEAMAARPLPEFYVKMVQLGAQTGDLPGVLTLVADYYQRANLVWTRLKGLMVYPALVLLASLGLSVFVAISFGGLMTEAAGLLGPTWDYRFNATGARWMLLFGMWMPVAILGALILAVAVALMVPALRDALRWWLPGFRENSLTNLASTMSLMLGSGSRLGEAIDLTRNLEAGSPAGNDLEHWKKRLAEGHAKFAELAKESKVFPPLFVWLVAQGGEDLTAGFKRAAEIYFARAVYRIELLLYAALPVCILVLAVVILGQFMPLLRVLTLTIDSLGDTAGP
jgi:type II secretory pathway component PulF